MALALHIKTNTEDYLNVWDEWSLENIETWIKSLNIISDGWEIALTGPDEFGIKRKINRVINQINRENNKEND